MTQPGWIEYGCNDLASKARLVSLTQGLSIYFADLIDELLIYEDLSNLPEKEFRAIIGPKDSTLLLFYEIVAAYHYRTGKRLASEHITSYRRPRVIGEGYPYIGQETITIRVAKFPNSNDKNLSK